MATIYVGPGVPYGTGAGTEANPYSVREGHENLSVSDPELVFLSGTYTDAGIHNNNQDIFTYGTQESERLTIRGEGPGTVTWITPTSIGHYQFQRNCKYLTIQDLILDGSNCKIASVGLIRYFTQHGESLEYNIVDGVTIFNAPDNGISTNSWYNNSIIRNCTIYNVGRLKSASNLVYGTGYNNTIEDCLGYYTTSPTNPGGFRMYTNGASIGVAGPGGGPAAVESHDNLIQRNECRGAQFNFMVSGNDIVVKNNVSVNPTNSHYYVTEQTQGTNIGLDMWNNTAYSASGSGITGIRFERGTYTDVDLANNGIYGPATAINLVGSISTVTPIRNATNLTTDPGFVDTAANDYHITDGGNWDETGTDLTASGVVDDKVELSRPQWTSYCVGAFEVPNPSQPPTNTLPTGYSVTVNTSSPLAGISIHSDAGSGKVGLSFDGTVDLTITAGSATVKGTVD